MGYQEIEIDTIGKGGKIEPFNFNLDNINYYRSFIQKTDQVGDKDKLCTIVYMKGSPKGLIIQCSRESFKKQIKEIQDNN